LDNPRIGWCKINDVPWFLFLWANPIHWFDEGHICISIQKNILSYVHIFPHDSQLSSAPTLSDILHVFFSADPSRSPNGGCNVLGTPQGPPQFKKLSLYIEAIFG
jgi:hypothetical protein